MRVLDKLLDDRRGPFDDFAGRDLVGEIRRQADDSARITTAACWRTDAKNATHDERHEPPRIHQNWSADSRPSSAAACTFMPKRPREHGQRTNNVAIKVSTFITSFSRLDDAREVRVEHAA